MSSSPVASLEDAVPARPRFHRRFARPVAGGLVLALLLGIAGLAGVAPVAAATPSCTAHQLSARIASWQGRGRQPDRRHPADQHVVHGMPHPQLPTRPARELARRRDDQRPRRVVDRRVPHARATRVPADRIQRQQLLRTGLLDAGDARSDPARHARPRGRDSAVAWRRERRPALQRFAGIGRPHLDPRLAYVEPACRSLPLRRRTATAGPAPLAPAVRRHVAWRGRPRGQGGIRDLHVELAR